MFVNYTPNNGVSVNSWREPAATVGDIGDILEAIEKGRGSWCCDLDGAIDALWDGEYLKGVSASQNTVEYLYNFLKEAKQPFTSPFTGVIVHI